MILDKDNNKLKCQNGLTRWAVESRVTAAKSLYVLCMDLKLSSMLTKPSIVPLESASDICLFEVWNGCANCNATFLFPSWQKVLFCFSVLKDFLVLFFQYF